MDGGPDRVAIAEGLCPAYNGDAIRGEEDAVAPI